MVLTKEDLKVVRNFLYDVRLKWYNIGLELGIDSGTLDEIQFKNHKDPGACLREMIKVWLKQIDTPTTWERIAEALRSPCIDEKELAENGKAVNFKYCSAVKSKQSNCSG